MLCRNYFPFILIMLISACVAGPKSVDQRTVSEIQNVLVVALEPKPLEAPALRNSSSTVAMFPEIAYGSAGGAVLFGILLASEAPEATTVAEAASKTAEQLLSESDPWLPTIVLAGQARDHLLEGGIAKAAVDSDVRPIPSLEDRSITFLMSNWYGPIKKWYGSDPTELDYSNIPDDVDAVLEVGLSGYTYPHSEVYLTVFLRLVEPETKSVIARTTKYTDYKVGRPEEAFADNGLIFKERFASSGGELIRKCLASIGLIEN
jgi:hypothetical protein